VRPKGCLTLLLTLMALAAAGPVPGQEASGLAEFGPRSAAMGGAGAAVAEDAAGCRGSAAGLARLAGPQAFAGPAFGADPAVTAWTVGGAAPWDGNGYAATVTSLSRDGVGETVAGLAAGVPVGGLPGLSAGAGLRGRFGSPSASAARGFGFDCDARFTGASPLRGVGFAVSAGVRDAIASLRWADGTERPVPRTGRLGAAARWEGGVTVAVEGDLAGGAGAGDHEYACGAEYSVAAAFGRVSISALALRAGWRGGGSGDGMVTGGLGARYGRFALDYAAVSDSAGILHSVALSWIGTSGARVEEKARPEIGGAAAPETPVVTVSNPWRPVAIMLTPPRRVRATGWSLIITDARGEIVWTTEGEGAPPARVLWNAAGQDGSPLPDGDYSCRLLCSVSGAARSISSPSGFRLVREGDAKLPDPDGPGGF